MILRLLAVGLSILAAALAADLAPLQVRDASDGDVIPFIFGGSPADDMLMEEIRVIPVLGKVTLTAPNLPANVRFVLFQAHSYLYNVTLSYNAALLPGEHINGTNVGLLAQPVAKTAQVILYNFNIEANATVLIAAKVLKMDVPIPGGCNMEFNTKLAPYLQVTYTSDLIMMKSQLAAPPLPYSCRSSLLDYDVYHLYLEERDFTGATYFEGVRKMLTPSRIAQHAKKVPEILGMPVIERTFSAYSGTGSVYVVVARGEKDVAAAYVPAVTYACSVVYWDDTCEVLTTTFSKLLCAIILFLGLFICFAGHYYFKAEMFVFGFLSGGLVAYILVALPGKFDYGGHLAISVLIGAIFGAFWLSLWWFYGIPAISTLLITLTLGYLVASTVFFSGAADISVFQNQINYWTAFLCIVVAVPIFMVMAAHVSNIVACSIFGAYAIIAPIDHYVGSNLKYIIINTVRKATNPDFKSAIVDPPFQTRDLILSITWAVLALLGICVQFYLHRNKPPFPPPPYTVLQDQRDRLALENDPLLPSRPTNVYASVSMGDDSVFESPQPGPSGVTR
ncbi:transmembrane 7 superfamily member 3-like [Neocloeon triangulifer]|uniref:transmembrane 7 superfamily member 3-like n=1 Tax=Neocloeon triangulifer TaxID=2078957 RepID=UPI00286F23DD|nr:transmembrane 7 superfamily member 3-like [Neocloeon triangulifer]